MRAIDKSLSKLKDDADLMVSFSLSCKKIKTVTLPERLQQLLLFVDENKYYYITKDTRMSERILSNGCTSLLQYTCITKYKRYYCIGYSTRNMNCPPVYTCCCLTLTAIHYCYITEFCSCVSNLQILRQRTTSI